MDENLNERVGTEVMDFEDRRRLACAEMVLTAERSNGGGVHLGTYGEIVLRAVVDESEVVAMGDRITSVLAKGMGF